jgi:hypothetical protein
MWTAGEAEKANCACALLIKHYAMKTYAFLTLALVEGKRPASHSGRFIIEEIAHSAGCITGYLGPKAGLDAVECRKVPCPCRE